MMSLQAQDSDVQAVFGKFGHVTDVFVPKDHETGRQKGFCFVTYSDKAAADAAIAELHGYGCVVCVLGGADATKP